MNMDINMVAIIWASPTASTNSSITEGTERWEQRRCRQQEGKQMLTLLLPPKNAHPTIYCPFLTLIQRFHHIPTSHTPCQKTQNVSVWWGGGLKKRSNKIGPFFFLRKTRNEALCTSAAVAHLKSLAWLLLCHGHNGDWRKTQTEPLCRCGAGY